MSIETSRGVHLEFAAEDQVGFHNDTGEVIIKEKAQNTLHKYELQFPENIYQEIWSEDFPDGVNTASVIAVHEVHESDFSYRLLLQDKNTSTTLALSFDDRKLLDSWHHEGILLTCFNFEYGVYAVEKAEEGYEIVIAETKNKDHETRSETRLQPVAATPTWSHPYLSVCKGEGRLAVTSSDHTLDIYDKSK